MNKAMKSRLLTCIFTGSVSILFIIMGVILYVETDNDNGLIFFALAIPAIGTSISSGAAFAQGEDYDKK